MQEQPLNSEYQTLPLLKFSHVTTASVRGPSPWEHLHRQGNQFAVFDNVACVQPDRTVKQYNVLNIVEGHRRIVSGSNSC